jgi:hypothetical protein
MLLWFILMVQLIFLFFVFSLCRPRVFLLAIGSSIIITLPQKNNSWANQVLPQRFFSEIQR